MESDHILIYILSFNIATGAWKSGQIKVLLTELFLITVHYFVKRKIEVEDFGSIRKSYKQ